MSFRLAIVTGASSGIGEALCRLLASKGIDLIITGRNTTALGELANSLSGQVKVIVQPFDLSLAEHRKKLIDLIHAFVPDLVINNAGFGLYGEALSYDTAEQLEIVNVNASAVLELTLEAARAMVAKNQKGIIVNISSAAGFLPFPCFSVYAASKAFVNNVSEGLDAEMRPYGIRVLAACPGMVATRFRQRAAGETARPGQDKAKHSSFEVMSASTAAEEIWKQIQKQTPVRIFNWYYRILIFLARFVVPKSILLPNLRKNIEKRYHQRPIKNQKR